MEAAALPAAREIVLHRPQLYPKQEAAIYDPAPTSVIEASTKSGKTSGCIVWLSEQAYQGRPGHQFWWVAPTLGVSKIAFRRLKRALTPGSYVANETECSITLLDVDTCLTFKGSDRPDTLYGDDVRAVVLDEATRMKEEAWVAVSTTVTATHGLVRVIGNKKGRRNWAYRLARLAEAGEPGMAWHKLTARDAMAAGSFDEADYLRAKRVMPPEMFKQLYDVEDADDEGNPFGLAAITACQTATRSTRPAVSWGWDLAKSIDYTVGTGLDQDGVEADWDRFQKKPWPETTGVIKRRTAGARALVDSTGLGDVILDTLQQSQGGGSNFEGFVFTQRSKQQLMEGLAASLQSRSVRYVEEAIRLELESFEYLYTKNGVIYAAPEGFHDDTVCSLALADEQRRRGGDGRGGLGGLQSRTEVPDGEIFNRVTHLRRMRAGAL